MMIERIELTDAQRKSLTTRASSLGGPDRVHVQLLAVSAAARTLHALLTAKPPHASYSGEVQEALRELGVALGEESPKP